MPNLTNSQNDYGSVAILLHWMMAFIIIGLIILGLYMVELPTSLQKIRYFGWHKEWGMLALGLVVIRLIWRWINVLPSLISLPRWEETIARFVHRLFFILLFLIPITGWLMSSATGFPVSFFGLFLLPNLIGPSEHSRIFFTDVHKFLNYALITLICLHVLAALKHYFINKDDILRRMLP